VQQKTVIVREEEKGVGAATTAGKETKKITSHHSLWVHGLGKRKKKKPNQNIETPRGPSQRTKESTEKTTTEGKRKGLTEKWEILWGWWRC